MPLLVRSIQKQHIPEATHEEFLALQSISVPLLRAKLSSEMENRLSAKGLGKRVLGGFMPTDSGQHRLVLGL